MTRLLGVDLGERRIGLAVGDSQSGSVRALATLRRGSPEADATRLARIAAEQVIDELVVGLPRNMDGSEGAQAQSTREWVTLVAPLVGLPQSWQDERLTSERAERTLASPRRGRSGGPATPGALRRHRGRIDREAAALIVQAALDARATTPR